MTKKVSLTPNFLFSFNCNANLGLGYITVDLLRDILKELDDKLSPSDLNEMIKEIDTDNSGTVDWEGKYISMTALNSEAFQLLSSVVY